MNTTFDLLNMMLVSSDPVITSHRPFKASEMREFHPEARRLLKGSSEILSESIESD